MIEPFRSLLQRLKPGPRYGASQATIQDVVNCYRLLLDRDPDEVGLHYWRNLITTGNIPVSTIVDALLGSVEYKSHRAARFEPALVQCSDFSIFVRSNDLFIGRAIQLTGQYEPHVVQALRPLLTPGATFVDVGANIGYFTLLAATLVGPSGCVIAFEPNPANCHLLRQSLAHNNITNARLYQNAVAESAQQTLLTDGGADSNGRIVRPDEIPQMGPYLPVVEAVTLDDALRDLPRVDVVKMDIEGAEPRAWLGMQEVVRIHRPILIAEYSPHLIATTSNCEPRAFLEQLWQSYTLSIIERSGSRRAVDSVDDIVANQHAMAAAGITHLDLIGHPRSG